MMGVGEVGDAYSGCVPCFSWFDRGWPLIQAGGGGVGRLLNCGLLF